jgi:hypothetical protein
MRSSLRSTSMIALCLSISGCSLVYDGSRFQGGTGTDGGGVDTGVVDDDGGTDTDTGTDDGGSDVDGGRGCTTDSECEPSGYCFTDHTCHQCDGDGDGFVSTTVPVGSCMGMPHTDCEDADATRHPGATPICNNGIDEGCFDPVAFPLEGVTEVGFIQPIDILNTPSDAHLTDVELFAHGASGAVVFTHLEETRRSPLAVQVDLAARTHEPMMGLSEWLGGGTITAATGTAIYTEAVRIGSTVHVAEIHTESVRTMRGQYTTFGVDGSAPAAPTPAVFDLNGLGVMGFQILHQPLLVQPMSGELFWAAPANMGEIQAIGTRSGHFASIDDRAMDASMNVWASSSERFGLFTIEGNPSYFVWSGNVMDPGAPRTTLIGTGTTTGGVTAPGVITTVDPRGAHGGPYALVALPKRGMIELYLLSCTFATPFACSPIATGSIATPSGLGTRSLAVSMVSDTSAMYLIADSDVLDGVHFGSMELYDDVSDAWSIPAAPVSIRIPADGGGQLIDLALDPSFTVDAAMPDAGAATVAYAYLRRPMMTAMPTHLSVGAMRACVGYSGF